MRLCFKAKFLLDITIHLTFNKFDETSLPFGGDRKVFCILVN